MKMRLMGAALGALIVLSSPVFADDVTPTAPESKDAHDVWVTDFDKAVERAKAEKKDLLVDFTGSDWCIWCKRLHEQVFAHEEFLTAAKKDFILVSLDFDGRGQAKETNPNPTRDNEVKQKYDSMIWGFPTVLLMNADGEVYAKTGYKAGGAAVYVEHIAKLRADGRPALVSAKAILAELASSKDDAHKTAEGKAIAALSALDSDSATAPMLAAAVKTTYESDAGNKSGLRTKAAKALLKSGSGDQAMIDEATTLDPKNELGLLECAVVAKANSARQIEEAKAAFADIESVFAAGVKDPAVKKQLAISGMFLAGHPKVMNDQAKAKDYAKIVRECGISKDEDQLKAAVDKVLGDESK